jgi:hypothetical protein
MEMRAGARLKSAVDATQVVIVRPPAEPIDLRCGGHPMLAPDADAPDGVEVSPDHAGGTLLGKRYVDDADTFELLCTKAGDASLSVGDEPLRLKEAKPLPASD